MRASNGTWFSRRTFASDDFDLDDLAERKRASGRTVSVVLPAKNEAQTVGPMVSACASLGGTLVDELVVIDGGSTDGTPDLAVEAGARVHEDSRIVPDYGAAHGKGDALWRSLAVTSGDIVCFVDADIRNPDPRFVWGLLGPLLHDRDVRLVKAFYDRPLAVDEIVDRAGGGRVTEILARPLLNLLWPPLAGLVQPLSGEYAGDRALLEAIPFFTGYGVEFGMLVDTLAHAGVDAIAQVDVGERVHRNQTLEALSQMAFGVAQVAARRLSDEGRAQLSFLPTDYVQFGRDDRGAVVEERDTVDVRERPPMRSLNS
jgi:glucosyl-3-phosphoglycerate synthase